MLERQLSNIDRFSREEYNLWKFPIQAILTRKDLYIMVDGTTIWTSKNAIEYTRNNNQALAIKCATIDKKIL
jgi:hypothetical protein